MASASVPFILISYGIIVPPLMKLIKSTQETHEEASALAFEIFSSIRVIMAFGAEEKLAKRHEALLDKAAKNMRKAAPLMGVLLAPSMMATYGKSSNNKYGAFANYTLCLGRHLWLNFLVWHTTILPRENVQRWRYRCSPYLRDDGRYSDNKL